MTKHQIFNNDVEFERIFGSVISITPHVIQLIGRHSKTGDRIVLEFSPYQGVKIVSIDCYAGFPPGFAGSAGQLFELQDSPWLSELRRALQETDHTADFLDHSRHFVVSAEDAVIEIIAPRWELKKAIMKVA